MTRIGRIQLVTVAVRAALTLMPRHDTSRGAAAHAAFCYGCTEDEKRIVWRATDFLLRLWHGETRAAATDQEITSALLWARDPGLWRRVCERIGTAGYTSSTGIR